jgi:hypothetical protein
MSDDYFMASEPTDGGGPEAETTDSADPASSGNESPCIPSTCAILEAECGLVADGCGGALDCGTCPRNETCGAWEPYQCGVTCVPKTCEDVPEECGRVDDGCRGTIHCGKCDKHHGG